MKDYNHFPLSEQKKMTDTKEYCEEVLIRLIDMYNKYGEVTVSDYKYRFIWDYYRSDVEYGWNNDEQFRHIKVKKVKGNDNKFYIRFPDTVKL